MKEKFLLFLALSSFIIVLVPPLLQQPKKSTLAPKTVTSSFFGSLLQKIPKEEPITIISVGDIMLGRSVNAKMRKLNNFTYPFLKTAGFLKNADLTFGNLESPLVSNCPTTNTGMVFCADPQAAEGLIQGGFDVLNLANNHVFNYGQEGFSQTSEILEKANLTLLLAGKGQIIKVKETTFGFLAFDLTGGYKPDQVLEKIRQFKNRADVFIVSFHWGTEYAQKPASWQIELAHQAVEAGASLILGHHSHVVQEVENYKGAIIIYSLGNFVFDQPWSEETKKGLVGVFTFQGKKLTEKDFKKISIKNFCQPEFEE